MGKDYLTRDREKSTVIIWFHPDCEHCLYQLTQINDHIHLLKGVRFFFFTAEKNFPAAQHLGLWPRLTSSAFVHFGIVDKENFSAVFGRIVTPTMFIFNREGKLEEKLYGEVKIGKIQRLISHSTVPEYEKSGLN